MEEQKFDSVKHPEHYQSDSGLEVIDAIRAFTEDCQGVEGYYTGNVIKYICRWKKKNGLEDLKKARVYLNWLIDYEEKKKEATEKKRPHCSGRYSWSDGEESISQQTRNTCEQLEKEFHEGIQEGIKKAFSSDKKTVVDRCYKPMNFEKLMEEEMVVDTIVFNSKSDAIKVLDQMNDLISDYGYIRVSEFYELCGLEHQYTDSMYGWDDISNAKILVSSPTEYSIQLPNAKKMENEECKIPWELSPHMAPTYTYPVSGPCSCCDAMMRKEKEEDNKPRDIVEIIWNGFCEAFCNALKEADEEDKAMELLKKSQETILKEEENKDEE